MNEKTFNEFQETFSNYNSSLLEQKKLNKSKNDFITNIMKDIKVRENDYFKKKKNLEKIQSNIMENKQKWKAENTMINHEIEYNFNQLFSKMNSLEEEFKSFKLKISNYNINKSKIEQKLANYLKFEQSLGIKEKPLNVYDNSNELELIIENFKLEFKKIKILNSEIVIDIKNIQIKIYKKKEDFIDINSNFNLFSKNILNMESKLTSQFEKNKFDKENIINQINSSIESEKFFLNKKINLSKQIIYINKNINEFKSNYNINDIKFSKNQLKKIIKENKNELKKHIYQIRRYYQFNIDFSFLFEELNKIKREKIHFLNLFDNENNFLNKKKNELNILENSLKNLNNKIIQIHEIFSNLIIEEKNLIFKENQFPIENFDLNGKLNELTKIYDKIAEETIKKPKENKEVPIKLIKPKHDYSFLIHKVKKEKKKIKKLIPLIIYYTKNLENLKLEQNKIKIKKKENIFPKNMKEFNFTYLENKILFKKNQIILKKKKINEKKIKIKNLNNLNGNYNEKYNVSLIFNKKNNLNEIFKSILIEIDIWKDNLNYKNSKNLLNTWDLILNKNLTL